MLHGDCLTVTGKSLAENLLEAEDLPLNQEVIQPIEKPIKVTGHLQMLYGNLASEGSVAKITGKEGLLFQGKAKVFSSEEKALGAILKGTIKKGHVVVIRYEGPKGGPGMPEWGQLPVPKKLLDQGIRDVVRISDARMSGTSYGACVLHVSPEATLGGPLALVQDGDLIELDVEARRLDLLVPKSELKARRQQWKPPKAKASRGYVKLFIQHVTQAHEGCDFDFLQGTPGETPEPEIF